MKPRSLPEPSQDRPRASGVPLRRFRVTFLGITLLGSDRRQVLSSLSQTPVFKAPFEQATPLRVFFAMII